MGKVPRQRRKLKTDIGKKNGRSKRTQKVNPAPSPAAHVALQKARPDDASHGHTAGSMRANGFPLLLALFGGGTRIHRARPAHGRGADG